jgi:Zn-dependent protease
MLINPLEIIDLIIMTAYLGFLFKDAFVAPVREGYDPLEQYKRKRKGFDWRGFKFAILVTAPAIVLHELSHKFVALAFGMQATFYAFYHDMFSLGLAVLSIIMKLAGSSFLFVIPGYVGIGATTPLKSAIISFAGPFMNLLLWLIPAYLLKQRRFNRRTTMVLFITKRINMFLFFFNMIPFAFFDGAKVFSGLFQWFTSVI